MIAITVTTNYADILPFVLDSNKGIFDHWFFVTDANDLITINLLKDYPNSTILFWDFQNQGRTFDKGGAIRYAQELAYEMYPDQWYLIIDSDICLSDNFHIDVSTLDPNWLYGANIRKDFYSAADLAAGTNYHQHPIEEDRAHGYFQLYKQKIFYNPSQGADKCDDWFYMAFSPMIRMLNTFECWHLGRGGMHWAGRTDCSDFKI
jgi:hypothetical protein